MQLIPKTHDAAQPVTTPWRRLYPAKHLALMLGWDDLAGTLNGAAYLEFSNDETEVVLAATVDVDSATNIGDREGLDVTTAFGSWRLRYVPNGIEVGNFFADFEVRG